VSRRIQALFFALGVAFLAFLIANTGPRVLLGYFARAGWTLVPVVGVWAVVYISNTVAWLAIVDATAPPEGGGGSIPFWRAYAITISSFAINYVTPMVALGGEPFRIAASTPWIGPRRAAASVVAFRVVHTVGQFIFWLTTIPVAYVLLPHTAPARLALTATAIVLAVAGGLILLLLRARTLARLLDVLGMLRLPSRFADALERARPALVAVDEELDALARDRPRHLALALAAEVLGRFIAALEFFLIVRAVGVDLGYGGAIVIGSFLQVVLNVFFFVPFEVGTREGGLYLIYHWLDLGPELGLYTSVITRLREVVWICIGLTVIWVTRGREEGGELQ
jgi:uncharacterized protein (TIRG00374 family)